MRYRSRGGKPDSNQGVIVKALRAAGASVEITSIVGFGFPDLVVGYRGRNWLFEVKPPGKRHALTDKEARFAARWHGQLVTIETADEALAIIGARSVGGSHG